MLVERMGKPVFVVGDRSNLKITVPEDVLFVEALIRAAVFPSRLLERRRFEPFIVRRY
jgi:hypothetical protein